MIRPRLGKNARPSAPQRLVALAGVLAASGADIRPINFGDNLDRASECSTENCLRPVYLDGRCKRHHDDAWYQGEEAA